MSLADIVSLIRMSLSFFDNTLFILLAMVETVASGPQTGTGLVERKRRYETAISKNFGECDAGAVKFIRLVIGEISP